MPITFMQENRFAAYVSDAYDCIAFETDDMELVGAGLGKKSNLSTASATSVDMLVSQSNEVFKML